MFNSSIIIIVVVITTITSTITVIVGTEGSPEPIFEPRFRVSGIGAVSLLSAWRTSPAVCLPSP